MHFWAPATPLACKCRINSRSVACCDKVPHPGEYYFTDELKPWTSFICGMLGDVRGGPCLLQPRTTILLGVQVFRDARPTVQPIDDIAADQGRHGPLWRRLEVPSVVDHVGQGFGAILNHLVVQWAVEAIRDPLLHPGRCPPIKDPQDLGDLLDRNIMEEAPARDLLATGRTPRLVNELHPARAVPLELLDGRLSSVAAPEQERRTPWVAPQGVGIPLELVAHDAEGQQRHDLGKLSVLPLGRLAACRRPPFAKARQTEATGQQVILGCEGEGGCARASDGLSWSYHSPTNSLGRQVAFSADDVWQMQRGWTTHCSLRWRPDEAAATNKHRARPPTAPSIKVAPWTPDTPAALRR